MALAPELERLAQVLVWNPEQVVEAAREHSEEAADRLRDPQLRSRGYVRPQEVEALVERSGALEEMPLGQPISFEAQPPALASFGIAEAENELRALVRAGYRVLVCFPHVGEAERTRLALTRIDVETPQPGAAGPDEAGVAFCQATIRGGVVIPWLRLAVLPSSQLFRRRATRRAIGLGRALAAFGDLRAGDYVVHDDHGVGRFVRFDTREVGGVVRDYLYLEFRGDDRLYVPHEQLGKVSRYIGSDGSAPDAVEAGRQGLEHAQGAGAKRGARAGRRAAGAVRAAPGDQHGRRFPATTSGRRGWRRRSPTRRPTTSSAPSTPSPRTWRASSRWTGWSAATSASARPRWPCGRP